MMQKITKPAYSAPRLVEYGSVRNLTGGSGGTDNDGGGVMTAQSNPGGM
jgi:hypothetical protein